MQLGGWLIATMVAAASVAGLVAAPTAQAAPIVQFMGSSLAQEYGMGFGEIPPDMGGAVGPTYVMQAVNGLVAYYTRGGSLVGSRVRDTTFWHGAGIPSTLLSGGVSDPRVIYDPASGHYFMTAITIESGATNHILVARSNSSNPLSGFKAVSFASTGGNFGDFPTLGVTSNAITIGTNNFVGNSFSGTSLFNLPKAALLQTNPSAAGITRFDNIGGAGAASAPDGFTLQPATNFSSSTTTKVLASDGFGNGTFHLETVTNTAAAHAAHLSASTPVASGIDGFPAAAHQPDGTQTVDTGDNRISAVTYQAGNYIYIARTIGNAAGTQDSVHWAVMNATTNTLVGQGLISSPNMDFYYPSIAANSAGKFVIALNGSGTSTNISGYDVICSNLGVSVSCGVPQLLKSGSIGNYFQDFGGGSNRWGDYSAIALDTANSNDFWSFLEVPIGLDSSGGGIWGTVITDISALGSGTGSQTAGGTGGTGSPNGPRTPVDAPEPGSLVLLAGALLGLGAAKQQR
jgi:hypothetical protein